jgi:hypothetical protein
MEGGVEAYTPSKTHFETLLEGHLSDPIAVEFEADLALKAYTNYYRIVIYYNDGVQKSLEHNPQKFLVFYPLGHGEQQFFISHKDPEDTSIAQQLAGFLKKLGLTGYLAEDDHSPGIHLWDEKIPAAISASIGVIILWTPNAVKNPANIKHEIQIAKSKRKRLIMALKRGSRSPKSFPKRIEYFSYDRRLVAKQLKSLAVFIYSNYRRGVYS